MNRFDITLQSPGILVLYVCSHQLGSRDLPILVDVGSRRPLDDADLVSAPESSLFIQPQLLLSFKFSPVSSRIWEISPKTQTQTQNFLMTFTLLHTLLIPAMLP